jgi:hypothetical protein
VILWDLKHGRREWLKFTKTASFGLGQDIFAFDEREKRI